MKKSDSLLLQDLKGLVARERVLVVDLLRHLREVERRELHLERGYSTLFKFCRGELGYSEQETQIRIQAMRLMKDLPETEEKFSSGELSLTVAANTQVVFHREELDFNRRKEIMNEVLGTSTREADKKLAELFPEAPKPEKAKPIGNGKTRIEFTASDALMEKFTRLKEILAHKNYDGRFDLLFEELADIALKKLEPENNAPQLSAPKVKHSRYVPASVKRKAKNYCEFQDPLTGRVCGERHGVQHDHIKDYAKGGTNAPENFQRLCGPHNRHKSRLKFKPKAS
ncbi:MAG: HNH endonuclease [Bdellovibrionota bacterium]